MVFPWIPFLKDRGGKKLSDIEFLSIKEFDGKLRSIEGFISATGDLATLTANTGKDMYLGRAKVTVWLNDISQTAVDQTCELKINGTVVETFTTGLNTSLLSRTYEFKNVGHKVAAAEIIKLQVTTSDAQIDWEGFIECFEETTGETPQVASI